MNSTAQVRRLYLHVAAGGSVTYRDMSRIVEWMERKDQVIRELLIQLESYNDTVTTNRVVKRAKEELE